jgi:hypothetical protein
VNMKPITALRIREHTNFKCRDELRKAYYEKKEVEEKLELVEKNDGNQSQQVIFLVSNVIARVSLRDGPTSHVEGSLL